MEIKVLVLGKTGMLGLTTYKFLSAQEALIVKGTERTDFDVNKFLRNNNEYPFLLEYDYIINCIGVIKPYCKEDDPEGVYDAIKVNALFPHELARFCTNSKVKIIQIATDCVYSGKKGSYKEDDPHDPLDVYGKTKSLGEVFIGNFLNIRCSIIGPEKKNKLGLLEWFLSQKDGSTIQGFTNHRWNGVTTLQFAKLCFDIIKKDKFEELIKASRVHHFIPNNSVTKFDLLNLFKDVFKKNVEVVPAEAEKIDRTLATKYKYLSSIFESSNIKSALKELSKL